LYSSVSCSNDEISVVHRLNSLVTDNRDSVNNVTMDVVYSVLHKLKKNNAVGPDGIAADVFTTRRTIVQSVVLLSHVVSPSVSDVGGS